MWQPACRWLQACLAPCMPGQSAQWPFLAWRLAAASQAMRFTSSYDSSAHSCSAAHSPDRMLAGSAAPSSLAVPQATVLRAVVGREDEMPRDL